MYWEGHKREKTLKTMGFLISIRNTVCCWEQNEIFSILPGAISKVGFGQNIVFWGDFLAQNNISEQRFHTHNLKENSVKSEFPQ